ncbi:hypothetical protein Tsubulata_007744, partial [Turnera subulata]
MPPKQASKADLAKKQKIVEDKTFGLKNKNKSKNVQKYVQSLKQSVQPKPDPSKTASKKKKEEEKAKEKELNELFKVAVSQPKVPVGVDPKSIVCEFYKAGQCAKGFKCKFSHDLNVQRKGEKIDIYSDKRDQETMDDWDQETLEKVVASKGKEYNQNKPTDIVSLPRELMCCLASITHVLHFVVVHCFFILEDMEEKKYLSITVASVNHKFVGGVALEIPTRSFLRHRVLGLFALLMIGHSRMAMHFSFLSEVTLSRIDVCKYFLEAVEKKQYGWFWVCPNGGKDCHYRHALPPGYVLKSQMKALLEEEAEKITVEEEIENQRAKITTSTPMTPELFMQWKKRKIEERDAGLAAQRAERAKNDRM